MNETDIKLPGGRSCAPIADELYNLKYNKIDIAYALGAICYSPGPVLLGLMVEALTNGYNASSAALIEAERCASALAEVNARVEDAVADVVKRRDTLTPAQRDRLLHALL
jgi:hypothetical protein